MNEISNKIKEGEQSNYDTTLDILWHINHLLFISDELSIQTDKQSAYKRWRLLQAVERTILPYAKEKEKELLYKFSSFTFPAVTKQYWNSSGAENSIRHNLNEYENILRNIMARAGFHIREKDKKVEGWDL